MNSDCALVFHKALISLLFVLLCTLLIPLSNCKLQKYASCIFEIPVAPNRDSKYP